MLYEEALSLEELGFAMSPWTIDNGRKRPTKGAEQWVNDYKSVKEWEKYFNRCDCIAIICGKRSGGVQVIDIDQKNDPTATLNNGFTQHLKSLHSDLYDKLYIESTMGGGLHFVFLRENEVPKKIVPAKGPEGALIEVLGEGQLFICAPSKGYKVIQGDIEELSVITDEEYDDLIKVCTSFNQMPSNKIIDQVKKEPTEDCSLPGDDWGSQCDLPKFMENYGWAICGEKNGTVYLRRPGKDVGISATWNHDGHRRLWIFSSSTELESEQMIKPFHVYATYQHEGNYERASAQLRKEGFGDSLEKFKKMFADLNTMSDVHKLIMNTENILKLKDEGWEELKIFILEKGVKGVSNGGLEKLKNKFSKKIKDDDHEDWMDKLERHEDESIKSKVNNVSLIFKNDPRFKDSFKFNEFDQRTYVKEKGKFVQISDGFMGKLRIGLSLEYQDFTKEDILTVVEARASLFSYHPLKEKLNSIEWDCVERVDSWLVDVMGAKDTDYTRQVGRMWLIGAIARIYNPGCQMDYMLILEGSQGMRKSTFFRKLSLGYFSDRLSDLGSKDSAIELFGNWIIEMAELECLKGKDSKKNKAFLTRSEDKIRLPHDKHITNYKRQNVFVGTTNEDNYLEDTTGNRRYWPVKINKVDNIDFEQLWAETLQLFRNGEKWWPEDETDFIEEQDKRMAVDDRGDIILKYLEIHNLTFVTLKEVHVDVLKNKMDFNKYIQSDLAVLLKLLGFERKTVKNTRGWYFVGGGGT